MARRFRARAPRPKLAWQPTVFNAAALVFDGSITEYSMFDPNDILQGAKTNIEILVKRVVFNGVAVITPQTSAALILPRTLFAYCYVIDADDSDANLFTSAQGSILAGNRVLHTQVWGGTVNEIALADITDPLHPGIDLSFDVRLNVKVRQDEFIVLGVQWDTSIATVAAAATLSGVARTLFVVP